MRHFVYVGIVGAEAAKFTSSGEAAARAIIRRLLAPEYVVLVSGGCHLGGIDIWAEEEYANYQAIQARPDPIIHLPAVHEWRAGYMPRNILIAEDSAALHNITVARVSNAFRGQWWKCYHCAQRGRELKQLEWPEHVKSGGCWTARQAEKMGKKAQWHIVANQEGK